LPWIPRHSGPIHARSLDIVLRGVEETTWQEGKSSRTERNTFFEVELASEKELDLPRRGRWKRDCEVVIPPDQPASFASVHNSVHYEVVVKTALHNLPDDENVYPVLVLPRGEVQDD
jgi:hypothetical protein